MLITNIHILIFRIYNNNMTYIPITTIPNTFQYISNYIETTAYPVRIFAFYFWYLD